MTKVETVETEKKTRRKPLKQQATVAEIIKKFNDLKAEVSELEEAITHTTEGTALHKIVDKELFTKRKELEDELDTVYYF